MTNAQRQSVSVCPRCQGSIPSNEEPGAYLGAASRAAGGGEICSACGAEEAFEKAHMGRVSPVREWPLARGRDACVI